MLQFQSKILRMIADGAPLKETMRQFCLEVERLLPGAACSVLTVDAAGLLHALSSPGLPDDFNAFVDGMMIGPDIGSCGAAAYQQEPVVIDDIEHDPRCARGAAHAVGIGLRACWSVPILGGTGKTIAVIALYFREPRRPNGLEDSIMACCAELCDLALRRQRLALEEQRRANVDALTGLANRSAFEQALMQLPLDSEGAWGLFIVDLDNLKIVNDTFGHRAGDSLIQIAATRISKAMAPDVSFRLGGDEFGVVIQSRQRLVDLNDTAASILGALEVPAICDGHAVMLRATIGGAVLGTAGQTANEVLQEADFALYHAKETGRGGFVRYWAGLESTMTHRQEAIRSLSTALAENRVEAHYQPILRLDTRDIVGLEALCRIRTRNGAIIPAQCFRQATDDIQVAASLTERMLATVAADIRSWLDQGLPLQHVGVNVSTADFYTGSLLQKLDDAFGYAGVSLDHLILEVNEDIYLGRRDRVVTTEIKALRANGVRIALDDFGTGYASLTHLLNVPIDIIKLDQSFAARLLPGDPSAVMVNGLIGICQELGIRVVAEGIETELKAKQLLALGCKIGQGFAFSRAVDRQTAAELLRLHGQGEGAVPLRRSQNRAPSLPQIPPLNGSSTSIQIPAVRA